jgi:hypothetical protein
VQTTCLDGAFEDAGTDDQFAYSYQ